MGSADSADLDNHGPWDPCVLEFERSDRYALGSVGSLQLPVLRRGTSTSTERKSTDQSIKHLSSDASRHVLSWLRSLTKCTPPRSASCPTERCTEETQRRSISTGVAKWPTLRGKTCKGQEEQFATTSELASQLTM